MKMARTTKDFLPVDPSEQSTFSFNFTPQHGPSIFAPGETIVSAVLQCNIASESAVQDPTPSARIISIYSIVGTIISQRFGNFVAGCTYQLVCTIKTSLGQVLSLYANVVCQKVAS
jgi:hypothetical protein